MRVQVSPPPFIILACSNFLLLPITTHFDLYLSINTDNLRQNLYVVRQNLYVAGRWFLALFFVGFEILQNEIQNPTYRNQTFSRRQIQILA